MERDEPYVGRWWQFIDEKSPEEPRRVQCDLCPRHCQLRPGVRGFCFVRQGSERGVILTTYGRSSGFCIDPIEKKPLSHFYPGSSVLSFGTAGCNLGCRFCQNWDISKAKQFERLSSEAGPEQIASIASAHGCQSVAFTYNDPVIFAEYAIDTAIACRERGVKSVAVSAGFITSKARPEFFSHMDAANIDLKGFTEDFYQKQTLSHLAPVLETLEYVANETDTWLEITTLLIPGLNDSEKEIAELAEWVMDKLGPDVPLHFTAFYPDYKMTDREATPLSTLVRARARAMRAGLRYVYTGNLPNSAGSSTYCPNPRCAQVVIERVGYDILSTSLYLDTTTGSRSMRCERCSTPIEGHCADKIGNWGSRRMAVPV